MKKEELLQQIDKLKLMVLLDKDIPDDLGEYHKWVDGMMGKISVKEYEYRPFSFIPCSDPATFKPTKYAEYKTMKCLVEDLYYKEHSEDKDYYEKKREIRQIIAEVLAMAMFIEEKTK